MAWIIRRKIIEVSDDFDDFIRDFRREIENDKKIRISIPEASDHLLREFKKLRNNGNATL